MDNIIPIVLLIIILILILMVGVNRIINLKQKLRHEVHAVEGHMHEAFDFIRDDLEKQVLAIEKAKSKRELTALEKKLFKTIKADLFETEKYLRKEIEDIEEQIG